MVLSLEERSGDAIVCSMSPHLRFTLERGGVFGMPNNKSNSDDMFISVA